MLKSVIICTAIAATFAVIPKAHAQYGAPYGGITTNDYSVNGKSETAAANPASAASTYDHDRSSSYQPYPSVAPSYGFRSISF
jgi:hypothetical protein